MDGRFMACIARLWLLIALAIAVSASPAAAQSQGVQTTWRLLDYIAVDYREAVDGGRVINPLEYDEMVEFSGSVLEQLAALPAKPARAGLIEEARTLQRAIAAKAAPDSIQAQARRLASDLLAAYPVPLAPAEVPDVARGAALYAQNCASCHGASGDAKVP